MLVTHAQQGSTKHTMAIDQLTSPPDKRARAFHLLAPTDGKMMPLTEQPSALHRHQLAGPGFWLSMQSNTIFAPCAGHIAITYLPGPTIRIKHTSGLQCLLELPASLLADYGKGLVWHCHDGDTLTAGQMMLRFDPVFLSQTPPLHLTLLLFPFKTIQPDALPKITYVSAQQPCFTFQLDGASP